MKLQPSYKHVTPYVDTYYSKAEQISQYILLHSLMQCIKRSSSNCTHNSIWFSWSEMKPTTLELEVSTQTQDELNVTIFYNCPLMQHCSNLFKLNNKILPLCTARNHYIFLNVFLFVCKKIFFRNH